MRVLLAFLVIGLIALAAAPGCDDDNDIIPPGPEPIDTTITEYAYTVVNSYPHDTNAFTEGLFWDVDHLIEGTGYFGGPSTLRRVELETGAVVQFRESPRTPVTQMFVFGEGVARAGDRIIQLTWTDGIAWVYDAATFDSLGLFDIDTDSGEGWGLTHDGARFIMSDGTSTLYFRDTTTFAEIGRVTVRDENGPVEKLNELEIINGRVWANIFESPLIVMIDPATGRVRGRLSLANIIVAPPDVANGIAYDKIADRLFVTGKRWPLLFEIDIATVAP